MTLNSSTLEAFYSSLVNTDTRYIILPKEEFISNDNGTLWPSTLNNKIIQFAKNNFPTVYQDGNYTMLEVPTLSATSKGNSSIGLVYQKSDPLFPDPQFDNFTNEYSHYYHPLSILALSNFKYDSFVDDDYTLFSREYVVLPFDPVPSDGYNINKYLEYVKSRGKLIVINSDNNRIQGSFAKLLSIKRVGLYK